MSPTECSRSTVPTPTLFNAPLVFLILSAGRLTYYALNGRY